MRLQEDEICHPGLMRQVYEQRTEPLRSDTECRVQVEKYMHGVMTGILIARLIP